jgi:hypothetical protein
MFSEVNSQSGHNRGDIFRVQTRRVSQTIVFRNSEIGGILCRKHRNKIVWILPKEHYDRNKTFFNILYTIYPDFSVAEHYG